MLLKDKTIIITGASRGIGRAILELFAQKNPKLLIVTAQTEGSLDLISKELEQKYDVKILPFYFDVSNLIQVKEFFQKLYKITKEIDVLINNAGILKDSLISTVTEGLIKETFGVNTFGSLYMIQYVTKVMVRRQSGSIINFSSIIGCNGLEGETVYSGSKAAVLGITKSASKELAPFGIRVNAISPGFIDTDMTRALTEEQYQEKVKSIRLKRAGKASEVAEAALFLASDMSSYITGNILNVDGGMVL